ncbi:MAG: hypothetical protein ACRDO1_00745 [Nocardioidaceae bacterium]
MTSQQAPLIGDDARAYVERDYDALGSDDLPGQLWERTKALKVLARECDSFARLLSGLAAWALAVAGGALVALAVWNDVNGVLRVVGVVVGVPLVAAAAVLGRRVWQAGRVVVDAFCWWTLLPEKLAGGGAGVEDWRSSPVRDAVAARVFVFQGWRPLRIGLGAVAFLSPAIFFALAVEGGPRYRPTWHEGQTAALWVIGLTLVVAGFAAGVVLMGGQWRANLAHSQRDPVQRKIFGQR